MSDISSIFYKKNFFLNFRVPIYSIILNRFYSMKLFQKICSSVIFQQKSDFFANYEHKMSDCVSFFFLEMGRICFHWIFWTILHKSPSEILYFAEKRSFSTHYYTAVFLNHRSPFFSVPS